MDRGKGKQAYQAGKRHDMSEAENSVFQEYTELGASHPPVQAGVRSNACRTTNEGDLEFRAIDHSSFDELRTNGLVWKIARTAAVAAINNTVFSAVHARLLRIAENFLMPLSATKRRYSALSTAYSAMRPCSS